MNVPPTRAPERESKRLSIKDPQVSLAPNNFDQSDISWTHSSEHLLLSVT